MEKIHILTRGISTHDYDVNIFYTPFQYSDKGAGFKLVYSKTFKENSEVVNTISYISKIAR